MSKIITFLLSKKGVEIAASTMVILIISVLIFGYSIYFLFEMWRGIEPIGNQIDAQTQTQITSLLKDSRQKIAIPKPKQTVYSGETAVFWIGIKNVGDADSSFDITTTFSGAFSSDGKEELSVVNSPDSWTGNFKELNLDIPPKQQRETFVIIKPDTQQKGVYVFKVEVKKSSTSYGEPKSVSVEVR